MLEECEENDRDCKESAAALFQNTWIDFYVESTMFQRRMKLHYRNADSFVRSMLKIKDVGKFLARANVEQVLLTVHQLERASSHINMKLETCMNAHRVDSVEKRPGIVPRREMHKFKEFVEKREDIDYEEAQQTLERLKTKQCFEFSTMLQLMREEYFPVLRKLELLMTIIQNEATRGYHDKLERKYIEEDYEAEQLDKERAWWRRKWSSFWRSFRRSLRWGLNNKFHALVTISLMYFSFSSLVTIVATSSYALIGYYKYGWTAVTSALKPLCQYFGTWALTFMLHKALSSTLEHLWNTLKTGPIASFVMKILKMNPVIFAGTKIASVGADVTQMILNDMPDDAEIRVELGDGAVLFGQVVKTTVKFIFHMALIVALRVLTGSFVVWCNTTGSFSNLGASIFELGNQSVNKLSEFVGFGAQTGADMITEVTSGNVLDRTKGIVSWVIDMVVGANVAAKFSVPPEASNVLKTIIESVNSLSIQEWSINNVLIRKDKLDQFNADYETFETFIGSITKDGKDVDKYKTYIDAAQSMYERVKNLPTLETDHAVEQSLGHFIQMIRRTFSEVGNRIDDKWTSASKYLFHRDNDQYFIYLIQGLLPIGVLVFFAMTALKSTKMVKLDPDPDPELEKGVETWSENVLEPTNEQGHELEFEVEQQQIMREQKKAQKAKIAETQRERMQRVKNAVENQEMLDALEKKIQKRFEKKQQPEESESKFIEDGLVEKKVARKSVKKPPSVKTKAINRV